jgi:glutathione peroxidase
MVESIYPITLRNKKGEEVPLSKYEGKVIMIVNIAVHCGFAVQLKKLEKLYQKYKEKGFVVIAVPTNDFAKQNPEDDEQTASVCEINHGVSFPVFSKQHAKGREKHAVFKYLTEKRKNGRFCYPILWNYQKYLIDKKGKVRHVYFTIFSPDSPIVERHVRKLLAE